MSREPLRQRQLLHWAGKHVPTRIRDRVWQLVVFRRPRPRWGNLRRTAPFSDNWGWDRGTPIDRVYIERFLREHAEDVRGDVLEIGGRYYTEVLATVASHAATCSTSIPATLRQPSSATSRARRRCLPIGSTAAFLMGIAAEELHGGARGD
jgi:hypothetical protein